MSSNNFQISFSINGSLNSNFSSAMASAGKAMGLLNSKSAEIVSSQYRLNQAWENSQRVAATYQNKLGELYRQLDRGVISQQSFTRQSASIQEAMKRETMSAGQYREALARLNKELSNVNAQKTNMQNRQNAKDDFNTKLNGSFAYYAKFNAATSAASTVMSPFVGAIETAMEFEAAMSKVGAISRASTEDMAKLTAQARELGNSTQFSATQAAEAMSYLGMAGWNAEQIMSGMPGLLALAGAGGVDLARAADIVSDDLTAFGLSASDAAHMSDVFAYTITRTNTNVEMMGETMKYAAPVARAFGATMEETAALTGIMGGAGIKASQAGTALRAGFLRLAGPPKKASKEMEELGITMDQAATEAQEAQQALAALGIDTELAGGQQKKMSAILSELREKTADLTREQRLSTLGTIFGTNAASGWLAVIDAAPETFDNMVAEMEKCDGEAAKLNQRMQDNAKGGMTQLKSAMESIAISVGSVFLPVLAKAFKALAVYAGNFARFADQHKGLVTAITGIAAAVSGLIVAFAGVGLIGSVIETIVAGFGFLSTALAGSAFAGIASAFAGILAVGWPLVAAIAAIAAISAVLYSNWDEVCSIAAVVSEKVSTAWEGAKARMQPAIDKIGEAMERLAAMFGCTAEGSTIVATVLNTLGAVIAAVFMGAITIIELFVNEIAITFDMATKVASNYMAFVGNLINGEWCAAWENAKNIFVAIWDGIVGRFQSGISAIQNGIKSIMGFGGGSGGSSDISVASNARGGIYPKGAFLTTFAEEGPEAAIPLDGSRRAISLWQKAGELLGMMPEGITSVSMEAPMNDSKQMKQANDIISSGVLTVPTYSGPTNQVSLQSSNPQPEAPKENLWQKASSLFNSPKQDSPAPEKTEASISMGGINVTNHITVNGNMDEVGVESIQTSIENAVRAALRSIQNQRERVSYA